MKKDFFSYIAALDHRKLLCWMSDNVYLKMASRLRFDKSLNIDNPNTFNEKMNWMKIHNRDSSLTEMADKYAVKDIVRKNIGEEYVVPCYGVWDSFDKIDFDILPNKFVLKTTHDSSGVVICKDKATFDFGKARKRIKRSMSFNNYYGNREWPYKNIHPRVIADMYLEDGRSSELQDYKFWCFDGKPKVIYITNKGEHIFENFYDMDFNPVDIDHGFPRTYPEYEKPKGFELMKELAGKLSQGIPFVRVDFFNINGKIFFGEYTFFDWGGMRPFKDEKWDREIGSWINLPHK